MTNANRKLPVKVEVVKTQLSFSRLYHLDAARLESLSNILAEGCNFIQLARLNDQTGNAAKIHLFPDIFFVLQCSFDKGHKKCMGLLYPAFKLRVKLHADKPGVIL